MSVPDYPDIVAKVRIHAAVCRELASTDAGGPMAGGLFARAERLENDAKAVERDFEMIANSQQLLDRVNRSMA